MSAGDWKEMYAAAQRGDLELLRYHLREGVDPNYQHPEILSTPLVTAIIENQIAAAKLLLENGADPRLRSIFDDLTPTEAAQAYGREGILPLLPADPGRTTFWGRLWRRFFKSN